MGGEVREEVGFGEIDWFRTQEFAMNVLCDVA
jgi:hypothetical protein